MAVFARPRAGQPDLGVGALVPVLWAVRPLVLAVADVARFRARLPDLLLVAIAGAVFAKV